MFWTKTKIMSKTWYSPWHSSSMRSPCSPGYFSFHPSSWSFPDNESLRYISRTPCETFLRILTTEVVMGSPWVQFIARDSSWHSGWLVGDNFWGNLFPYMILTYDTVLFVLYLGGGLLLQEEKERILLFSFCRNGNLEESKVSNWENLQNLQALHFWGPATVRHLQETEFGQKRLNSLFFLWHSVVEVEVESWDVHVKVLITVEVVLDGNDNT